MEENNTLDTGSLSNNTIGTENLPNYIGILVLGICSIVPGCICYGIPGIICGIIALSLSSKAKKLLVENPNRYTEQSKSLVMAGKICAIVGISLSSLYFIFLIVYFAVVGSILMNIPHH